MFLSGRSRQQSYANLTSVEVYVSVSSTLKHQRCRNPCFWKFVSLHPICKIEVHLRPECFLAIREYASYYRLPAAQKGDMAALEGLLAEDVVSYADGGGLVRAAGVPVSGRERVKTFVEAAGLLDVAGYNVRCGERD